ncbi:MAG: NUDIX domain-containing protein [Nocardioidaceae bacterium]
MNTPPSRLVVGAAIMADGRLLATRRTEPPALAGGWELPGGKVDPGETPEQAVVREIREELDCDVRLDEWLDREQRLNEQLVLRVVVCRLVDGEPRPVEHDALRWLAAEELGEVSWLPADEPFLAPLRERLLDGERLPGGNVGGAVRVGTTVRRPTGPWTPNVHALLRYLREVGLDGVPRVLGVDERDREILTYLPGEVVDVDATRVSDAQLTEAMRWLRRYHDAVRGFRPSGPVRWRFAERTLADDEIVCHHDVAPYNMVFRGDRLTGVFDWDLASPGRPVEDLAFAAWNSVPLFRPVDDEAARLRLMAQSYGDVDPLQILHGVQPRIASACRKIAEGQAAGDVGMLNLATVGEPGRTERALVEFETRIARIESEL